MCDCLCDVLSQRSEGGLPWRRGSLVPASSRRSRCCRYHCSGTIGAQGSRDLPAVTLSRGTQSRPCFSRSPGPRRQQTLCSSISGRRPELRDSWRNVSEAGRVLSSGLRVNTGGRGCRPLFPRHLREAAKSLRFRLSLSQRRSPNAAWRKEIVHFIFPAQVCLSFDFQWNWPGVRCLFHGETHSCRLAQMVVNLGRLQTRGFSPRHE